MKEAISLGKKYLQTQKCLKVSPRHTPIVDSVCRIMLELERYHERDAIRALINDFKKIERELGIGSPITYIFMTFLS